MNELSNLRPPKGAKKGPKRVGRGEASGQGKTAGRGHKGLKARSGGSVRPGYEGGQMPLLRRLPKRGFINRDRQEYAIVSLRDLAGFAGGGVVDPAALAEKGVIRGVQATRVKVLANGTLALALTVKAHKFSRAAKEKIEAAGGKAEVL
jgi:large subunit ribosomal protein L15